MEPRDAAGIVVLRVAGRGQPEVLLGRRRADLVFMPGMYVFPGGRVEREEPPVDFGAGEPLPHGLDEATLELLPRLMAAALRELEEETGLRVQRDHWPRLRPLARAITPPGRPRRFDTRFFALVDPILEGSFSGDGELEDLRWLPVGEIGALPVPNITNRVLREALAFLEDPQHPFRLVTDAASLG